MADVVLGCLVYLNDDVYDRRIDMCRRSLSSFKTFENQSKDVDILFVNNGGGVRVSEELKAVTVNHQIINLKKNFFDISVHMCSYWRAVETGASYFAYTYDDFVFYDSYWPRDAVRFMDTYNNVACLRLPKYVYGDGFYNANVTSKHRNPEAVRHEDGAGGHPLEMIEVDNQQEMFGTHEFYFSNWRPNSRPMLWRVDSFSKIIDGLDKLPVMQSFEALMYAHADAMDVNWTSGFINGGVCHTFPVETSERTQVNNHYRDVVIDISELRAAYVEATCQ